MKALDNLRGTSIKTNLSTSIIQGVNDDRLPELADFYMKNPDLFTSWRIRTQSAIGRHTEETNLYLSDLLNLVCDALHVNRDELLKTLNFDDSYHGATHLRFDVLSKMGKTPEPLGFRTHVEHTSKAKDRSKYKTLLGPDKKKLLASMSPSQKVKAISSFLFNPSSLRSYSMHIYSWPNAYNIDLEEASQSGIYHVGPSGKPMSFQNALLLNDLKPDWDWEQR